MDYKFRIDKLCVIFYALPAKSSDDSAGNTRNYCILCGNYLKKTCKFNTMGGQLYLIYKYIKKRYCFFPVSRKHNAQNAGMAILIVVTASNKPPAQTVLLALYMYARFFPVKCNCF